MTQDNSLPLIMVITQAFTIRSRGTVVLGQIACDSVKFSDRIVIVGDDLQLDAVCGGFEQAKKLLNTATRGQDVGMLICNLETSPHPIKPGMAVYLVESSPAEAPRG